MGTKGVLVGLYITVLLTLVSLFALLVMTPVLLKQMERLTSEWETDFDDVKALSDEMWTDLLKMGAEMRLPRDRLRRQYEEFGGSSQESSYSANSYSYPAAPVAPTYGYGIAKVKCCCAMKNIDYEGEHRNLPVSYKCPIGSQGPPGPIGEPGEDGQAGQPGYNGEDYPQNGVQSSSRTSASQYSNGYGSSQGYSDNSYDSYGQPAQEICEPCPRGLPGNPGPKGKPGIPGNKGDRGIQGIHGIPGVPGIQGPPGDVGVRGRSGSKGLPGPRGADALAGGKGLPGAKGQAGSVGVPGPRGVSGPAGSPGADGARGRQGIRGSKGQRGLDGVDGIQGPPGVPGSDAGYCKCPDRVHNVDTNSVYGGSEPSGYNNGQRSKSNGSPPSATPQQDSVGTSRAMEHRFGNTNEISPSRSGSETREYTTSVHVGDLAPSSIHNVQGTRREYHPQPSVLYQPPRSAYYAGNRDSSGERSSGTNSNAQVRSSANPYGLSTARSNDFASDEEPVIQDWNDDVRRRQRILLQKKQRQRYFGRS